MAFTDAQGSGAADVVTRAELDFNNVEGSAAREALGSLFSTMTLEGVYTFTASNEC